jgi:hypothetical protein
VDERVTQTCLVHAVKLAVPLHKHVALYTIFRQYYIAHKGMESESYTKSESPAERMILLYRVDRDIPCLQVLQNYESRHPRINVLWR